MRGCFTFLRFHHSPETHALLSYPIHPSKFALGTHAACPRASIELVCDKLIVGAVRSEQRASVFEILAFGITLQRLLDRFEIPQLARRMSGEVGGSVRWRLAMGKVMCNSRVTDSIRPGMWHALLSYFFLRTPSFTF